ncbi:MAG: deoxyribose-phosphate aldolase [Thermoprotei archaeon]|nr:deoxyribose-phosphate aldolase [Thermoprotei archaeon]
MNREVLAKIIDYALVKPNHTKSDIIRACEDVLRLKIGTLCVLPPFVSLVAKKLSGSDARVCAAVAFPFGANPTEIKVKEVQHVIREGANEIDFVANIPLIKSGEYQLVRRDIEEVVCSAKENGDVIVKVIIETGYLTPDEIILISRMADEAGVDYVKTCTGFGPRGATLDDIRLIKRAIKRAKIKAAGGISTYEKAMAFIKAGASRIGTSHALEILEGGSSS